jgi:hypothetical protein
MSNRKSAIAPLNVNTASRYFAKIQNRIKHGNDRQRRTAIRTASRQAEMWSDDQTCPWDDSMTYHRDFLGNWSERYHGAACLEQWALLANNDKSAGSQDSWGPAIFHLNPNSS